MRKEVACFPGSLLSFKSHILPHSHVFMPTSTQVLPFRGVPYHLFFFFLLLFFPPENLYEYIVSQLSHQTLMIWLLPFFLNLREFCDRHKSSFHRLGRFISGSFICGDVVWETLPLCKGLLYKFPPFVDPVLAAYDPCSLL